jgi:hypothetical protein
MTKINLEIRIKNLVKNSPNRSLAVSEIRSILEREQISISTSEIKKSILKMVTVDKKLRKDKEKRRYYLQANKGGNGVRYVGGGEIVRKGAGPYRDIARVIDRESKRIQEIFQANHLNSYDVHAGRSVRGEWGRPDMLVALYNSPGKSRAFALHTIEFERIGGFSASNIAQAYYSGRGADKSWLLFNQRDWPRNNTERSKKPDFHAIEEFAKELGVGLISYGDLALSNTWKVLLEPKQRKRVKQVRMDLRSLYEERKIGN